MKSIPLESNFYIEKLGFAGAYLSFLFWLQNIDCGYSLEPPSKKKKKKKKKIYIYIYIYIVLRHK